MNRKKGETRTEKQRRIWNSAAPRYDQQIGWCERMCFSGGREWIGSRADGKILEIAIGTGLNLPYYPDSAEITGLELSPAMLNVASQRARRLGLDVTFIEGDAEQIPFNDGTFDAVSCALALCSIPNPDQAVAEMYRVLKPGGKLLLLDHVGSTWPPLWVGQWLVERISVPVAGEYYTRRHVKRVRAAGFDIVERERLKAGMTERLYAVKPG